MTLKPTIYIGTFVHTPRLNELEALPYTAVFVDANGVIVKIEGLPEGYQRGLDRWVTTLVDGANAGEGKKAEWDVVRFDERDGAPREEKGVEKRRWIFPGFVGQ